MAPSRHPPSTLPVLPGPSQRKQNLACDSCRKRKVRCLRTDKTQICQQCNNKGEECTNNFIDSLAQAKGKKGRKSSNEDVNTTTSLTKRKKKNVVEEEHHLLYPEDNNHVPADQQLDNRRRSSAHTVVSRYDPGESSRQGSLSLTRANSFESSGQIPHFLPSEVVQATATPILFNSVPSHSPTPDTPDTKQLNLINYLLSSNPVISIQYGYTDLSSISMCNEGKSDLWEEQDGKIWREEPSDAHRNLNEETRKDLVDDLIDTFFSIVQPRYTMLDPTVFRERFESPNTHILGHLPHAFLAIVLTWGARFSNHPIILADREECSSRDGEVLSSRLRSRLVGLMVIRTREVAESKRIFRIPTMDNANSCLLLEHLLGQICHLDVKRYQSTYISSAVQHLISMGLHSSAEWSNIQDTNIRNESLSYLWIIRMSDASRSALHRLMPAVSAENFDINPVDHAMLSEGAPMTVPLGGSEHNVLDRATWFKIHHSFCSICHTLAKSLWIPSISTGGIPFTILREFIHSSSIWRDKYLSSVGIPTIWPESWNFLQAVTTCATDCYYHDLWLVVHKAIQDFGIKEEKLITHNGNNVNVNTNGNGNKLEIENIKRRIKEEAEHAALRIAALTGVLTENGYLKLDPLIINHPIYSAGEYLASLGRSEYLICVAGLRQYSTIYPSLWDQADQLDSIYQDVIDTNTINGMVNNGLENAQPLWIDGMIGIPPRLDLMDSFSDWTGSIGSLNPQPMINGGIADTAIASTNVELNVTDGIRDAGNDGIDIGPVSDNVYGGTQPSNVGQWLGW